MEQVVMFLKQVINGVQVGSIYALVALGYTMVYGIVKLLNFAHGDFIMVGAYISLFAMTGAGMPVWLAAIIAVAGCALLGVLTEKIAYKPLRNSPKLSVLITAIGVSLFLQNLFLILFTSSPKPYPNTVNIPAVNVGPIQISGVTLVTIVLSAVSMIALQLFVKKTKMGRAMRAVSEDAQAATLMGVNVNHTISLTFAVGSGLAAIAAVMYCTAYPMVDPYMGSMLGLKAFIAAVLGGIGSLPGALLGGLIVGVSESMAATFLGSTYRDSVAFIILIIVLIVRPHGLFGRKGITKV